MGILAIREEVSKTHFRGECPTASGFRPDAVRWCLLEVYVQDKTLIWLGLDGRSIFLVDSVEIVNRVREYCCWGTFDK